MLLLDELEVLSVVVLAGYGVSVVGALLATTVDIKFISHLATLLTTPTM